MALGAYQKISRVISGKPFGDGSDGAYSSASIPTMKVKACTGTATNTKFAADTDATPFEVGDVILLHQSRGSGVGQWEIVKVDSVGSDEYNITTVLNYTYVSPAQATVIKQYTDVTVQSGTWTVPTWGGATGGILTFACNGELTVTGTIEANYKGFRGGASEAGEISEGWAAEGSAGATVQQYAANGSGGGGAKKVVGSYSTGGGGGGNGAGGTTGEENGGDSGDGEPGRGGSTSGAADLITSTFGGGGGGVGQQNGSNFDGGDGGGMVLIYSKTINEITGLIRANGAAGVTTGSTNDNGGTGGAAGGSIFLGVETATLGTSKITVAAGPGGSATAPAGDGGAGAVGRIAVHHSGAITGSTTPSLSDTEDLSLIESGTGNFLAFL